MVIADALAYLLPVPCAACGTPGRALCGPCSARLAPAPRVRGLAGVGPVVAGLAYDGVARAALLALKEHGATVLAAPLAPAFAAAVGAALAPAPDAVLTAVPSTRAARRRRGYEPVRVLAAAAGILLTPVFAPAAAHAVQKGLGADERTRNLEGVFALDRDVAGRRVVLLDDVLTTGATLAAAAAVLRAGGAEVAGGAVVALAERRDGRAAGTPSVAPASIS